MLHRLVLFVLSMIIATAVTASAQPGVCGDLNNNHNYTLSDFDILVDYLFHDSTAPDSLWAADVDGVAGVTLGDFQVFLIRLFVLFPTLSCEFSTDTYPVASAETTYVRNTLAPPGAVQQTVEIWYQPTGEATGFSFPFSYSCETSGITLDSIVPEVAFQFTKAEIDSGAQKGLLLLAKWMSESPLATKSLMASLYFTIDSPDPVSSQQLLIDTTGFGPSHTYLASRNFIDHGRPVLYGTPNTPPQPPATCCFGATGDVSGDGLQTLTDLTLLVNHLFVTFEPLICPAAGNVTGDADCKINLSDVTQMVRNLFVCFGCLNADCSTFDNFICGGQ